MSVAPGACVGSVVFTDLVGFTEFNDAAGDVRAVEVLDCQTQLAAQAVAGQPNGRVVKELGDGLMLWFGTADAAVAAALQLLESVETERQRGTFPLAIRMGAHHGEALSRGDDIVGHTINVGARISDLAGPSELLVSDEVIGALSDTGPLHRHAVGPVRVKGVEQPIWIQRITA